MGQELFHILSFLGALALFVFGLKRISEASQRALGNPLRHFLQSSTSSPSSGVFTGLITSFLIHSSSATSVMLVSFVNAGLLKLRQAIGVIMGANIGTTLTSGIILAFAFTEYDISRYGLPLIAIGLPITLSRNELFRAFGEGIVGASIILFGLHMLKGHFEWTENAFFHTVGEMMELGGWSVLLFLLIGGTITFLLRSSAATLALLLTFATSGAFSIPIAIAVVLGANLGTTITANLAAGMANVNGKRTALTHLLFNLFGVLLVLLFFQPVLQLVDSFAENNSGAELWAPASATLIAWTVILFHFAFNTVNSFILVPFAGLIAKGVERWIPPKGVQERRERLEYIDSGLLATPELSLIEARKEIEKFGEITHHMSGYVRSLIYAHDPEEQAELLKKVRKYEEITDRIEMEVADYLSKISQDELSKDSSLNIRSMMSIANDLERVGDILFQMSQHLERKFRDKLWFTQEQREALDRMFSLIEEAFSIMLENLDREPGNVELEKALSKEKEIDAMKEELRNGHLKHIEEEDYNIKSGLIYHDLFTSCEKVGDHIINVSEALKGKV